MSRQLFGASGANLTRPDEISGGNYGTVLRQGKSIAKKSLYLCSAPCSLEALGKGNLEAETCSLFHS